MNPKFFLVDQSLRYINSFHQEVSLHHYLSQKYQYFAPLLGFDDKRFCILLKYFPSGSLKSWVRSTSKTRRQIMRVILDINHGIQCMHRESFAHCDIKSDNVLIEFNQKTRRIQAFLTDFGISRVVSSNVIRVAEMKTVAIRGLSIAYASPDTITKWKNEEDFLSVELLSRDIYASACVLYECMTGNLVWTSNTSKSAQNSETLGGN